MLGGRKRPMVVTLLLEHHARVTHADWQGDLPLAVAVHADDPALVALLLKAGADPTVATQKSEPLSALHVAGLFGSAKAAKALLTSGRGP